MCFGSTQSDQPADHVEVLVTRQQLVRGGVLTRQPDELPYLARMGDHVVTADGSSSGVRGQQGREHPDGGRFSGSVRSEQAEHDPWPDDEVNAVESLDLPKFLDEAL